MSTTNPTAEKAAEETPATTPGQRLLTGKVLFEIEGMSEEIAREAFRLASAKLSVSTAFVKRQVRA